MTAEEIAALEDAAKRSGGDILLMWDRLIAPTTDPKGMQRFRESSSQLVGWMKTLPSSDAAVMNTVMTDQIRAVIEKRKSSGENV